MNEKSASLVSIIILNYNAGKLLHECVESIFKSNNKNFEVILVDNASSDKTYKQCKEKFNTIILLENKKNLGYCEGNNVGIRHAQGKFIVVLNPDTLVEPDWLNKLISAYENNGDGIYQPKILANTDHGMLLEIRIQGSITSLKKLVMLLVHAYLQQKKFWKSWIFLIHFFLRIMMI